MITRRKFLSSLAAVPALLALRQGTALASVLAPAEAPATGTASHAVLHALAPGATRPEGWLGLYLEKQARGLTRHLPEIAIPYTGAYWAGEEKADSWWPWEQKAYWIDGALRCALVTGDQDLLPLAQAPVDYTLAHVWRDGYLGPAFSKDAHESDPKTDNFRWPHTVFFRAMAAHGEATNDPRVAAAMQKHYLSDRTNYGGPSRNVTNVEGMLWAYARTGNKRLLALAEKAWNDFTQSAEPADRESGDLHPKRVFAGGPIGAHGVTYIEKAKLPAILYMHTGKPDYLRFALAAQKRIFDHHMLIDGIPSTSEDYRGITALDSHETCDISDHTWTWGYLLMATGDGIWGDRIERACFNAGFGAIKKDWKAHQYFSCPNQVLATQTSNHAVLRDGRSAGWMSYRPGHTVACCSGNVHRYFPNYVLRMWMRDPQRGLVAALYGPSRVRAEVGPRREPIEIREETNYPFEEEIHFTVRCARPVAFPLSFRVPGWCTTPRLFLNDKPLALSSIQRGFVCLNRTFNSGDKITLVFSMKTALSQWPDNGVGIEHGPLVYSMPIKEDWAPLLIPQYSTREFPAWDAAAAAPWNYGLALEQASLESEVKLRHVAMTEDPWVNPPITLTVPLQKIAGWELAADPRNTSHKFTPPLPRIAPQALAAEPEGVTLVPYGTTHLRLTVFPQVRKESKS